MTEPLIFTKNYVDENSVFTMSHGSTFEERLFDGDKDSQYVTVGANSDATQVTIQCEFQSGGAAISRIIGRVMLLNHNFDDYIIDYWDGSAWQNWATVASGVGGGDTFLNVATRATTKFRVLVSATSTTNAEKLLAQLIACEIALDPGVDLTRYTVKGRERSYFHKLGDGSEHKTIIKHSPNRTEKYECNVGLEYVSEANFELLRTLANSGDSFLWQPESTQRPDEIYHVNLSGPISYKYSSSVKAAGFSIDFQLSEI